jgi:glycosyltransferase involved in cell wall biosynthesis
MSTPVISVILPAYNCEAFIHKAISSVLIQSFTDFELIIINDGSTDNSESIISSFTDPRIVYQKNDGNRGLIFTLNRAIDLARGKYIARMDADDICLPERLEKQKNYLDQHENITAVAATVDFINELGEKTGVWYLDRITVTPEQIKKVMPSENCIAHPTVMIRSEILKKLKYKSYQKNMEDYDLWLRMLNRGYLIGKINESLLLYRAHAASVTGIHLKKNNFYFRHMLMKWKLLWHETFSGHLTGYLVTIKLFTFADLVKGIGKYFKNLFIR